MIWNTPEEEKRLAMNNLQTDPELLVEYYSPSLRRLPLLLSSSSPSLATHAEVRMLHVNGSPIFFSKCLIVGASLLFFCQSLSPEPGKHSTTMQTMVIVRE